MWVNLNDYQVNKTMIITHRGIWSSSRRLPSAWLGIPALAGSRIPAAFHSWAVTWPVGDLYILVAGIWGCLGVLSALLLSMPSVLHRPLEHGCSWPMLCERSTYPWEISLSFSLPPPVFLDWRPEHQRWFLSTLLSCPNVRVPLPVKTCGKALEAGVVPWAPQITNPSGQLTQP